MASNQRNIFSALLPNHLMLLCLVLWGVINFLTASFSELANDEAYYVMFSRFPDWGYFDHPPMVAWLIYLGRHLFGDGEGAIRCFHVLLQPIYLWLIWDIVRPLAPSRKEVWTFLGVAFSLPLLQLYGFLALPDAPLMFFTALFLWSYYRFLHHDHLWYALVMGFAVAALAYSKYHGALVVLAVLFTHRKPWRSYKFYLAGVLALVLIVPHLYWQYQHDWASFRYHLTDRKATGFHISYIGEYLANVLLVFNPLLLPLIITSIVRKHRTANNRIAWCLMLVFLLFFLYSSHNYRVQAQWLLPVSFSVLILMYNYLSQRGEVRYFRIVAYFSLVVYLLLRVVIVFNPIGLDMELFNNKSRYNAIAEVAGERPVVFAGKYAVAAKYTYYTGKPAFARPNINYRTSQYQFWNAIDSTFVGKEVALQCNEGTLVKDTKGREWMHLTFVPNYHPVRRVTIDGAMPDEITVNEPLTVHLTLYNPYDYDINIDGDTCALVFALHKFRTDAYEITLPTTLLLKSHTTAEVDVNIVVEQQYGDECDGGFALRSGQEPLWWQSEIHKLRIIE